METMKTFHRLLLYAGAALWAIAGPGLPDAGAETCRADGRGRIMGITAGDRTVRLTTDLRLPSPGWKNVAALRQARNLSRTEDDGRRTWTGVIEPAAGQSCRFVQVLTEMENAAVLRIEVTALEDTDLEGVYFFLDVPIAPFAGGTGWMWPPGGGPRRTALPEKKPPKHHLLAGMAERIRLADSTGEKRLEMALDRAYSSMIQDNRAFNLGTYSCLVEISRGALPKGDSVSLQLALSLQFMHDAVMMLS